MATPAFRAVSTQAQGSGTTATLNAPTHSEGDLLVASLLCGSAPSSVPSGWSLADGVLWYASYRLYVYYKVAGASEPSTYDWTFSSSVTWGGQIESYYNVDTSDTFEASDTASGSGTAVSVASITTGAANALLFMSTICGSASGTYSSWSSPLTERIDSAGMADASGVQASAGASGAKSCTLSTSLPWGAVLAAFNASSGTVYDETDRQATAAAVVALSDLQTYQEAGLSAAGVVLVPLSDVQAYRDLGLAVPVSAIVAAAEAQVFRDAVQAAVAASVAGSDAQVYSEEDLLAQAVASVTLTDAQVYQEALSVNVASVVSAASAQAYSDAGLEVSVAAQAALSDLQTYAEGLSVTVGSVVAVADALGSGEELALVAVAAAQVSDLQTYLEGSMGATAAAQLQAADVQAYRDTLAALAAGPITLHEAQAYLETGLLVSAVASVGVTDALAAAREGVPLFIGSASRWTRTGESPTWQNRPKSARWSKIGGR